MNMTAYENPWFTPYFDEVNVLQRPNIVHPVENTQELLREFEDIYNTVHYTHLSPQAVVPPQINAPPQDFNATAGVAPPSYTNYYSVPVPVNLTVIPQPVAPYNNGGSGGGGVVPQDTTIVVDEIVRSRCQDLTIGSPESWQDENTSSSSSYTSALSPRSESDSCYGGSAFSDDENGGGYRRAKPYDKHQTEKKSRKKEQNKNAATRYRQKKKQEVEEILVEEQKLSKVNEKLEKEYNETKRELKYVKNLMREMFKNTGLLD